MPCGEIEEVLADTWASVLRVERVGRKDDFLEIGGDSIRAMQILNRIRKTWGVDLPASVFFSSRTVAALAEEVESRLRVRSEQAARETIA